MKLGEDLERLDLPILPPEASIPPLLRIHERGWLRRNEEMVNFIKAANPQAWTDQTPVDVRFEWKE